MLGVDDEAAGDGDRLRLHPEAGGGADLVAALLAQGGELGDASDVALAPRGDAVAHPVLLAGDLAAELLRLGGLVLQHLLAPGLEMREAALHATGGAVLKPDDGAGEGFEHAAVVADQHDAGAQRGELALEPLDGGQVEVVGRLVEQQQLGGGGERAGERGAPGLAAGETRGPLVAGQAQLLEQGAGAVGVVRIVEAGLDIVEHSGMGGQVGLLLEIAQAGAGLQEAGAVILGERAGGDAQQRGLARAVAAAEADALAGADGELGAVEQRPAAQGEGDVLQVEKRRHRTRVLAPRPRRRRAGARSPLAPARRRWRGGRRRRSRARR